MGKSTLEGQMCKRKDVSPINASLMLFCLLFFAVFVATSILIFICFLLMAMLLCPKAVPWLHWSHTHNIPYRFDGSLTQRKPLCSGQRHKTCLQHHKHHIHTVIIIFRCNKMDRHPCQAKRNRKTLILFYLLWHLPCPAPHSVVLLLFWQNRYPFIGLCIGSYRKNTLQYIPCEWAGFEPIIFIPDSCKIKKIENKKSSNRLNRTIILYDQTICCRGLLS